MVLQDEILDEFISQLRERALTEFRQKEKEAQNRYELVRELSMKLRSFFPEFSREGRQAIETYIDEKDSLTSDELDYVYIKGILDCCKLLKLLKLI